MAEYGQRVVDHTDLARAQTSMVSRMSTMLKRRGAEDVDGALDVDDADVAAGVDDVGRVLCDQEDAFQSYQKHLAHGHYCAPRRGTAGLDDEQRRHGCVHHAAADD